MLINHTAHSSLGSIKMLKNSLAIWKQMPHINSMKMKSLFCNASKYWRITYKQNMKLFLFEWNNSGWNKWWRRFYDTNPVLSRFQIRDLLYANLLVSCDIMSSIELMSGNGANTFGSHTAELSVNHNGRTCFAPHSGIITVHFYDFQYCFKTSAA